MRKKASWLVFFMVFLIAPSLGASAVKITPVQPVKPFVVENIGTASVPAELEISAALGTQTMTNLETQYDLRSTAAIGSHYARLVVYKDPRDLGLAGSLLDLVDFKPELVTMLSNMEKNMVAKQMEEHGLRLVEWLPASTLTIQKHNAIQMGARFTLSEKMPLPMFAAVAVYPQNGKLTGLALLCPDSDQAYWQPIFTQLITTMK